MQQTVCRSWLGHHLIRMIAEVNDTVTDLLWIYNHEQPDLALEGNPQSQN